MNIEIASREVAEAIAQQISQDIGQECKVYSSCVDSVLILHTAMIARITPLRSVMDVAPTAGPFVGYITEIPLEARSVSELREIAHAIDEATSHVTAAAIAATRH